MKFNLLKGLYTLWWVKKSKKILWLIFNEHTFESLCSKFQVNLSSRSRSNVNISEWCFSKSAFAVNTIFQKSLDRFIYIFFNSSLSQPGVLERLFFHMQVIASTIIFFKINFEDQKNHFFCCVLISVTKKVMFSKNFRSNTRCYKL